MTEPLNKKAKTADSSFVEALAAKIVDKLHKVKKLQSKLDSALEFHEKHRHFDSEPVGCPICKLSYCVDPTKEGAWLCEREDIRIEWVCKRFHCDSYQQTPECAFYKMEKHFKAMLQKYPHIRFFTPGGVFDHTQYWQDTFVTVGEDPTRYHVLPTELHTVHKTILTEIHDGIVDILFERAG